MAESAAHPALFTPVGGVDEPADPSFGFHLLARHGRRPIGFYGRLLVACDTPGAADSTPVSRLVLYELAGGGFAGAIQHGCGGDGASPWQDAVFGVTAEDLGAQLRAHDPVALPLTASAHSLALPAQQLAQAWRALRARVLRDAA